MLGVWFLMLTLEWQLINERWLCLLTEDLSFLRLFLCLHQICFFGITRGYRCKVSCINCKAFAITSVTQASLLPFAFLSKRILLICVFHLLSFLGVLKVCHFLDLVAINTLYFMTCKLTCNLSLKYLIIYFA